MLRSRTCRKIHQVLDNPLNLIQLQHRKPIILFKSQQTSFLGPKQSRANVRTCQYSLHIKTLHFNPFLDDFSREVWTLNVYHTQRLLQVRFVSPFGSSRLLWCRRRTQGWKPGVLTGGRCASRSLPPYAPLFFLCLLHQEDKARGAMLGLKPRPAAHQPGLSNV